MGKILKIEENRNGLVKEIKEGTGGGLSGLLEEALEADDVHGHVGRGHAEELQERLSRRRRRLTGLNYRK